LICYYVLYFSIRLLLAASVTERRTSTVRSAHDAELEDVLGIFDLLDKKDVLQTVTFVAFDLS